MASNFMERATKLQTQLKGFMSQLGEKKAEVLTLLEEAKATEEQLLEKEQAQRRERLDRERAERLQKMLESDEAAGVHVGGNDGDEVLETAEVAEPVETAETVKPVQETKPTATVERVVVLPSQPPVRQSYPQTRTDSQAPSQGQGYPRAGTQNQGYPRAGTQGQGYPRAGTQGQGFQRPQAPADNVRRGPTLQAGVGRPGAPKPGERAVSFAPTGPARSGPQKGGYDRDRNRNKNKKTLQKEAAPSLNAWDDNVPGSRKVRTKKQLQNRPEPVVIEQAVITTESISVKNLSEKIGKPAAEIIKKLFLLDIPATINQELDFDTCTLIAGEYNITLVHEITKTFEDVLADSADDTDAPETLITRPPVVTIMGHVDHGKTSLLDAIRDASVTAGEAGGITQHIGAYTVTCSGKQITFVDTPGHEAFTSMRARGAQVTDIVILVVAADDGIMPQTVEAINHAKAANVPIIVAVNKIDRAEANPDRVKQQLTEYGLVTEEWGGDTICVSVSAKEKTNLDSLLEMILLQAEVLELKANPNRLAKGTIVEAKLDKARGPIATILVQNGTLKKGDTVVAGTAYGRVRAMIDDKGRTIAEAGPSMPVEVLGLGEVPEAGDILNAVDAGTLSRRVAEERRDKIKVSQIKVAQKISLDELFTQMEEGDLKDLNIIVKADVQGSVEAVKQALEKLSNEEVRVRCIHGGVGAITGSDIMFASASNAIVIGFNVRPDTTAKGMMEREKVDVRLYHVIYAAIEDVENAMKGLFAPVYHEVELGKLSIRETFKVSGIGMIAGAYVQEGKVQRSSQVRVVRDGIVLHTGKIGSLKRFKDDAREVLTGFECGISIEGFNDIRQGDHIEAFVVEEVKR